MPESPVRSLTAPIVALLAGISAASWLSAAPDVGFRQASRSDTALTMLATESGIRIQNGSSSRTVPLPESTWMQSIERIGRDGWVATGTDGRLTGRRLLVKLNDGSRTRTLSPPPLSQGALAWWPVPIVHRSELVGLVWLEGDRLDRLAVVAARWDGRNWDQPVVISPPGVGSQAGLTATVLGDGTWLLAWTRFDGEDDEVVWSQGDGVRFSRPLGIAAGNSVPDILPSLAVEGQGGVIAWSQDSADGYQLKMARFDGRRWSHQPIAPTPAVAPRLLRQDGTTWVSLWATRGSASEWVLARINAGKLSRIQGLDGSLPRPAMVPTAGKEPRLQPVKVAGASR